jgi:hypothetical protein
MDSSRRRSHNTAADRRLPRSFCRYTGKCIAHSEDIPRNNLRSNQSLQLYQSSKMQKTVRPKARLKSEASGKFSNLEHLT